MIVNKIIVEQTKPARTTANLNNNEVCYKLYPFTASAEQCSNQIMPKLIGRKPVAKFEHTFEKLGFEIQMRRHAPPSAPPRRHLGSGWGAGGLLNYFIPHWAAPAIGLKQLPAIP